MASAESGPPRTVSCYHCRRLFDAPGKAISISCPWCYKRVGLDDMTFSGTCWTSKVQTCGKVVVRRKSTLVAPLIEASEGIDVFGAAEGTLVTNGRVYVGPKGRVKGDVRAPSLFIEKGAVVEGGFFRIELPEGVKPGRRPMPPTASRPLEPEFPKTPVVVKIADWVRQIRMG